MVTFSVRFVFMVSAIYENGLPPLGAFTLSIAASGAGYGIAAFGFPVPWSGNPAASSIANYFSGRPMTNGTHFRPELQPDYLITAYGRNDQLSGSSANSPTAFSAALSSFLQGVRSLCEPAVKTTKIFCIVPFAIKNNTMPYKAQIDAYFPTQTYPDCFEVVLPLRYCYVDNSSADFRTVLGPTKETVDGIHPTLAEHQVLANAFAHVIGGLIPSTFSDFNRDASVDLVWQNNATGDVVVWYMNGAQWSGNWDYLAHNLPTEWRVAGPHRSYDYNYN